MFNIKEITAKLEKTLSNGSLREKESVINSVVSVVASQITGIEEAVKHGREAKVLQEQLSQHKKAEHEDPAAAKDEQNDLRGLVSAAEKAKRGIDDQKREARSLLSKVKELEFALERVLKL